jgi:hypothetical protein
MPDMSGAKHFCADDGKKHRLSPQVTVCLTTPSQTRKAQTKRRAFLPSFEKPRTQSRTGEIETGP